MKEHVQQGQKQNLAAVFGFVLSTTTDFPSLIACSAISRHFVIVPNVSYILKRKKQNFEIDDKSLFET
jgi:hypothetical protein